MNLLHAFILGIVEGLTEFLPVSSTGHLILAARLMGLSQTEFLKTFEIAIQSGAILAVIFYYWKTILRDRSVIRPVLAAFIPTGVLGLVVYKIVKKYLMAGHELVLWTLFIGGVILIVVEKFHREPEGEPESMGSISTSKAIWIGVCQSMAMIPGVSRSAATIVGGLLLGIRRKTIVEFSFLLAIPTLLAATGLDLVKSYGSLSLSDAPALLVGLISSFFIALLGIRFFLGYIQRHSFILFGVYRILLAVIFWFALS